MRQLLVLSSFAVLVGCSSGPETVEDMDSTLESRTSDKSERVGIRDDEFTIQKRTSIEERLFKLKGQVEDLQLAVYGKDVRDPGGLWLGLKDCRKRMADPRIGGNGTPDAMEKWQNVAEQDDDFDLKLGKKGKQVVAVSEERLQGRVDRLKSNKRILESAYSGMKDKLDRCESSYRTALVDHGMNPEDRKARGEWVMGPNGYKVWKMKEPKTDDPEEIMRRKKN